MCIEYDALGQLIRVNAPHENATWAYAYDCGGNILSKNRYAYTTGAVGAVDETIPYTYGDSNWKDKLTNFNGNEITYDDIGNPLSDGIWTYTWEKGRQLKVIEREDTWVEFKYDHNGMRVQKVVQQDWYPVTTNYTWHGKLLTHMTVDYHDWDEVAQQDVLHFYYDVQKRPAKVKFNGTFYTYIHNLQGDIVGILDSTGVLVVEYKYDAWGKPLSTTGSMAETLGVHNPFRYRGYVYDLETGLYYLQSRYYVSEQARFVNAEDVRDDYESIFQCNLYSYCVNNPVSMCDIDGKMAALVIYFGVSAMSWLGAVALTAIYAACTWLTIYAAKEIYDVFVRDIFDSTNDTVFIDAAVTTTAVAAATVATQATSTTTRKNNTNKLHMHHIVAKMAWKADPARAVLELYGINVWRDPRNLVPVSSRQHSRLHTNRYYSFVNAVIVLAGGKGEEAVEAALFKLGIMILSGTIPR